MFRPSAVDKTQFTQNAKNELEAVFNWYGDINRQTIFLLLTLLLLHRTTPSNNSHLRKESPLVDIGNHMSNYKTTTLLKTPQQEEQILTENEDEESQGEAEESEKEFTDENNEIIDVATDDALNPKCKIICFFLTAQSCGKMYNTHS